MAFSFYTFPGFSLKTYIDTYGPCQMFVTGTNGASKGVLDLNAYTASFNLCFSGLADPVSFGTINGQTYSTVKGIINSFFQDNLGMNTRCLFSGSVGLWSITNSDAGTLHITASNSMKRLLGLTGSMSNVGLNGKITANQLGWFMWQASTLGYGDPYSHIYEGYNTWNDAWSRDSTRKYSLGSTGQAVFEDWSWSLEPTSNVFQSFTGSANRPVFSTYPVYPGPHYTWERLVYDTRSSYPWYVISSSLDVLSRSMAYGCFQFRDEGSMFQEQVKQDGFVDDWKLDVKANRIS